MYCSNGPYKKYLSNFSFALAVRLLGMAPFAVGPFRSRFKNLPSGPPLGSFRHDPVVLKQSKFANRILYQDKGRVQRLVFCLSSSPSYKGRLGGVSSKRCFFCALPCALGMARTARIKNISLISALHLPCAFWVWLASLSSRLTVDTKPAHRLSVRLATP